MYEIKNIYIAPSSQEHNEYAYGNTTEEIQCNAIADYIVAELKRYNCNVYRGNGSDTLASNATKANAIGCTSYYAIHTNAGGGRGVTAIHQSSLFVPKAYRDKSKLMATELCAAIASLGRTNRGLIHKLTPTLQEFYSDLRRPKMAAVILEIEFHDWVDGAKWIIGNKATIGKTIARTIAKIEGLFRKYNAVVTAVPNLNVRSGPGTNYTSLRKILYGKPVTVYAEKTNEDVVWCRISPSESEWVSKEYIKKTV